MPKWNGGVIGVANNPTISSAKGIWSLSEATKAIRAGLWPPSNAGADPYFENVTMLLSGDGTNGAQNNTFLDSSTNNFTITRNGNTTQGTFTPFSKPDGRWSNYFTSAGTGYLQFANNAAFEVGSGDFCYEAWIYLQSYNSTASGIISYGVAGSTGSSVCSFDVNPSGNLYIAYASGSGQTIAATGTVPLNQWVHVVACRSGSTLSLFQDGTRVATGTTSATVGTGGIQKVGAQWYDTSVGRAFVGYISNARIVKGSSPYNAASSTITVSTSPLTAISGTSLLTCQSNRFVDNSANAFAITVNGSPSIQTFSPFPTLTAYAAGTNGGSGYFDGSGDYLTVPDNAAFDYGSGNFTIEAWVYPAASPNQPMIIGQWSGSLGGTGLSWALGLSNDGNRNLRFLLSTNGSGVLTDTVSSSALALNAFNHVALVRNGDVFTAYLNGVAATGGTYTISAGTALYNSNNIISIGANSAGGDPFNGYISNVRIVKGTAVYTAAFTPPTAPLTAITNTSLLCNFTNGGIVDAAMSNDLETVGNAQISTTQSKFGGASMYFDGNGDYLISNSATTDLYAFGSGDWTIEFWVYFNTTSGDGLIVDMRNAADTTQPIIYRSTTTILYAVGSGTTRITSGTITTGTWYHVAVCRSGTSTKMFINGTQAGSTYTDSTVYTCGAQRPIIGAAGLTGFVGVSPLNGYIDDLRITKGYARYTANFTAPVAPFVTFGD